MVIGESVAKDAYRLLVWGPWRQALEHSPWGWEYRANRKLGTIAGRVAWKKRREVEENLRRAFPGRDDLGQVALDAFATHFVNQYASFAFGRIDGRNYRHYLRLEGVDHLDRAARDGVGVVLMHPHTGPAQLPLAVLGALGRSVHQVGGGAAAVQKSRVGGWASAERSRLESRMRVTLHDGAGYLRGLLGVLARTAPEGGILVPTSPHACANVREARILIIDDDPVVVAAFRAYLVEQGYRVETAFNGGDGLMHVAQGRPDVTLLDIRMPGLDGFAVLDEIRSTDPSIPVIMVTAKAQMTSPRTTAFSHRPFWVSVPPRATGYDPRPCMAKAKSPSDE